MPAGPALAAAARRGPLLNMSPAGLGIYFASSVFFNVRRVNAVAAAVCIAILFVIESPTRTFQRCNRRKSEGAAGAPPSPASPPDDPVSRSSIDLVKGSPVQGIRRCKQRWLRTRTMTR